MPVFTAIGYIVALIRCHIGRPNCLDFAALHRGDGFYDFTNPQVRRRCAAHCVERNILIEADELAMVMDGRRQQVQIRDLIVAVDSVEIYGVVVAK